MKPLPKSLSSTWIAAGALAAGVSTAAQQALNPFDAATIVRSDYDPPFRRMADLDLDGDVDSVGWHVAIEPTTTEEFRVRSYLNDGSGRFPPRWSMVSADSSAATELLVEIGLLDAGPVPDLSLVHGNELYLLYGKGDGGFTVGPKVSLPAEAAALALSDLDGDGRDDLVWADSLELRVQTSSGLGGQVIHGVLSPRTLRVLPRNGPVAADVFLLHGDSAVSLFYGSPTAGLVAGPSFVHGLAMTMFDTGDVDGDGDIDGVVFGGSTPYTYRVLRRSSAANWALEPALDGGPAEFLRDVDGDGDLDGACCGGGEVATYERHDQPSPFQIALNDGDGGFAPVFQIPGIGSPQLAGVVDVDADGDVDLVAGGCVYYASGAVRAPAVSPGSVVPPVAGPREIADCDGDGDPDVGFSLDSVYVNDGSGSFFAESHGVRASPRGATHRGPGYPGDFDGDSDLDLLVETTFGLRGLTPSGSQVGPRSFLGMSLLANDGQGELSFAGLACAPGVTFAIDSLQADASLAFDLEGDGDLDLITRPMEVVASSPRLTRFWVNDGTGFFQALPPFYADRRVELAVDLNLDGLVDLVASEYPLYFGAYNLRVYRAVASDPGQPPTFVEDPGQSVGRLMGNITVGNLFSLDAPDDGYPDLFYLGAYAGVQGVLTINGFDPDYLSWGYTPAGGNMPIDARAHAGDLNNDGLDDELVGASGLYVKRSEVRLKYGPLWQEFTSSTQILPTGHLVDLDLDGDLDLLGDRIVFNRTIP